MDLQIFIFLHLSIVLVRGQLLSYQREDGWYNNLANIKWGAAGTALNRKIAAYYEDYTYIMSMQNRPNVRDVSNKIFRGSDGRPSGANRTALQPFFSQFVALEVMDVKKAGCPTETGKIPLSKCDLHLDPECQGDQVMPFIRSTYDKSTGKHPNRPRIPTNAVTTWIDGSFVYGNNGVWCSVMRARRAGKLKTSGSIDMYPGLNKDGIQLKTLPQMADRHVQNKYTMWMFGNVYSHENPGLTSIALLWFRWHNHMADVIVKDHPDWSDEAIFRRAKQWTVATMQNIIAYEWLPAILNATLPDYDGYHSYVQPALSPLFSTAMNFYQTLMPPGIYIRNESCAFKAYKDKPAIRLCNSYWNSQAIIKEVGMENILLGLASQLAENEDRVIVEDYSGMFYGPYHYSRLDESATEILRGRDFGIPDYLTVKKSLGLADIPRSFKDINLHLFTKEPELLENLSKLYNDSLLRLDVFVGGLLESDGRNPGELFKSVLLEQFDRTRKADRFWFENSENGLFTPKEIQTIRETKLSGVIIRVTNITPDAIQTDVFFASDGAGCQQPKQLSSRDLEPCMPLLRVDYFNGSEITYVTTIMCICLFPLLCLLTAYIIVKIKHRKKSVIINRNRTISRRRSAVVHGTTLEDTMSVTEWRGRDEPTRSVEVGFQIPEMRLHVVDQFGMTLRQIDLKLQTDDVIDVSIDCSGKHRNTTRVHIKRGYDLVIQMIDEYERKEFLDALEKYLIQIGKTLHIIPSTLGDILKNALTKKKRQAMLAKFFRYIFSESNKDSSGRLRPTGTNKPYSSQRFSWLEGHTNEALPKEIMDCEITKAEFAEALAMDDNSTFVENLFALVDTNRAGCISAAGLLSTVVRLTKGTVEEKLRLFFRMYDTDGDGLITKTELKQMLGSLMDTAHAKVGQEEIEDLVTRLMTTAGSSNENISFEEFHTLFKDHVQNLGNITLDWKGTGRARKAMKNVGSKPTCQNGTAEHTSKEAHSAVITKFSAVQRYVQNYRQHILFLVIFYGIVVFIFMDRFWKFQFLSEHKGLRRLVSFGLAAARGAADVISFCFSALLLTMCRNIITILRQTSLSRYVPFDSNVAFHKLIAYTALFFTGMHVLGYSFNFYQLGTQSAEALCALDAFNFMPDSPPKLDFWFYRNSAGLTGILLCFALSVMYVFSTQWARRHVFDAFWVTHSLYLALFVLTIIHGTNRISQNPWFIYYVIGPAVLFGIDKLIRLGKTTTTLKIIDTKLLPSDVTYIEFQRPSNFSYMSGQWARIACTAQGKHEFHPFTLTSSPQEENLSVHVRAVGPWTWNIRENMRATLFGGKHFSRPYPDLILDGPYGSGQQDWFKFDVSVLVGGGIGVTPYASILKDFVYRNAGTKFEKKKIKCQKLYFLWVTGSHRHYEWFIDIMRKVEEADEENVLSTDIFITQFFHKFDLRTTMLYICEEHFQKFAGKSMFTNLQAATHFGRPQFTKYLTNVARTHPRAKTVGVFSCGPQGLTHNMEKACVEATKRSETTFKHHFENF